MFEQVSSDHLDLIKLYMTMHLSFLYPSKDSAEIWSLFLPHTQKNKQINKFLMRQTTRPLLVLTPHKVVFIIVRVRQNAAVCFWLCLGTTIFIPASQHPHRKELKHEGRHNQAAEWNCSPCARGTFQSDGIIKQEHTYRRVSIVT